MVLSEFPPTGIEIEVEADAVASAVVVVLGILTAPPPGLKYEFEAPALPLSPSVLAAGVKGGSLRFFDAPDEGVMECVCRCGRPIVDVAGVFAAELDTSGTEF